MSALHLYYFLLLLGTTEAATLEVDLITPTGVLSKMSLKGNRAPEECTHVYHPFNFCCYCTSATGYIKISLRGPVLLLDFLLLITRKATHIHKRLVCNDDDYCSHYNDGGSNDAESWFVVCTTCVDCWCDDSCYQKSSTAPFQKKS